MLRQIFNCNFHFHYMMPPGYELLAGTVITRTYARSMVIFNRHMDVYEKQKIVFSVSCLMKTVMLANVWKITQGSTCFCFRHHISAGTIEFGSNRFMVILNARYPVPGMSNA